MISAQAAAASGARTGRAGDFGGFRTRWALLISVAGGLALFASFPPVDAWPLAVLGPALLVIALAGRSLRGSFGCALAFGLAQFVPLLSWLVNEAWYAWAALAVAALGYAGLLGYGGLAAEGKGKTDKEKLQGTWITVAQEKEDTKPTVNNPNDDLTFKPFGRPLAIDLGDGNQRTRKASHGADPRLWEDLILARRPIGRESTAGS